jgi:3-dehydroquinate synthase
LAFRHHGEAGIMATLTIDVPLGERAYGIHLGAGLRHGAGELLADRLAGKRVLLVSDDRVAPLHAETVMASLRADAASVEIATFPHGEGSKTLATVERLCRAAVAAGLDRGARIVALGGGVVGDVAGFTAAAYMRGIPFVQMPTTLLAMVDSSVGGKTGVDLPEGKNLVGAFWQPERVLVDPEFLLTLPACELRNGLAEVVKTAVIFDAALFARLEANVAALLAPDLNLYREVVARCCELKAGVVVADEREGGLRAVLNYGHTFGHALETLLDYQGLAHGEAVAIGMAMAANFAVAGGELDAATAARQRDLLSALGLPVTIAGADPDRVLSLMSRDKKASGGELRLVVPREIGRVEIRKVADTARIRAAIAAACR